MTHFGVRSLFLLLILLTATCGSATPASSLLAGEQDLGIDKKAPKKKTFEEKLNDLIDSLMEENPQLTREQAEKIAKDQLPDVVNIYKQGWPGSAFLDIVNGGSGVIAKINSRHKFFADFYSVLESLDDKQGIDALETFIYAFALAEDNIAHKYNRELDGIRPFEDLRNKLGLYLDNLLKSG